MCNICTNSHVIMHTVEAVFHHSKPRSCWVLRTVEVGPIFSGPSAGNRPCLEQSQGSNTRAKAAAKAATLSAASSRLPGRGENQAQHSFAGRYICKQEKTQQWRPIWCRPDGVSTLASSPQTAASSQAARQIQLPQMKSRAQPILLMPNPPILLLVLQY